jgi:hypothetical protein
MKKLLLLGRDLCPKGPFEEETKPRIDREWGKRKSEARNFKHEIRKKEYEEATQLNFK